MKSYILSAMLLASPASATLIDLDNVTRDTATGLDWLDVTETVGLTTAEVNNDPLYTGWTHATDVQICDLALPFFGAGPGCGAMAPPPGVTAAELTMLDVVGDEPVELIQLLGITVATATFGFRADGYLTQIGYGDNGQGVLITRIAHHYWGTLEDSSSIRGHFLVRVPEPNFIMVFAFVLAFIIHHLFRKGEK